MAKMKGVMKEVGQTSRGYTIWVEPNKAGGRCYWSDSINDGVMIWDTALTSEEELLFCLAAENKEH